MAIEKTKYVVVTENGPFEIRDYTNSLMAIVTVSGSRSDAVNSGFRLLADYIFGKNQKQSTIEMTSPVTQIAQASQPGGVPSATSSWVVRFMMPTGYTLPSLPVPTDTRVHFEEAPARRVAAIRFSGFWSDANLKSHEIELLQWMRSHDLTRKSVAAYAYYDPPWTPWFMRTNEILIDIAPR